MKKLLIFTFVATIALMALPTVSDTGIVANSAHLWFDDCMKKSVPNKTNFCNALYSYINGKIRGGNPTGRGCVEHMASKGFTGAQTRGMCYWYFTDN